MVTLVHNLSEELAEKTLLKTDLTPNQLTISSFFFMVAAAFCFAWGNYRFNFLALFFILVSVFLDFSDGLVYRRKNLGTPLGAWLDPTLDTISQLLILFAINLGILRIHCGSFFWTSISLLSLFTLACNNLIGSNFNKTFGFDSYVGSAEFSAKFKRGRKKTKLDLLFANIIMPSRFFFIFIFTLRYFIIIGVIFNIMPWAILFFSLFNLFKLTSMFLLYAYSLKKVRSRFVVIEILKKLRKK